MTEREPNFSRSERKKRLNRSGNILNMLIGVVVLLIIIVVATIFLGNDSNEKADDKELITTDGADNQSEDPEEDSQVIDEDIAGEDVDLATEDNNSESSSSGESEGSTTNQETDQVEENSEDDSESSGSVTYVTSDDDIIAETVIDTAWQPIGTIQTGEHASQYDTKSVDWAEKQQALAYATGLSQDSMIFWRIKNGGGPQKSVGIVSSKDKTEKYRVYLEWVDGQGWKPVKMDVLKTLDFEY